MSGFVVKAGNATYATAQGPRDHQEDRSLVAGTPNTPEGMLLSVFDGHGGDTTAQFALENIRAALVTKGRHPVADRLGLALYELGKTTLDMQPGSTVSAVHIVENTAHVAFMGDSPVVVINDKGDMVVTEVHNVFSNWRERQEAMERGGAYRGFYIYGPKGQGLQLTRSLGDSRMGKVIKREPETFSVKLGTKSVILVCSDGVLDLAHNEDETHVDTIMHIILDGADADDVLTWAEKRCLNDNATVIVYRHQ